MRRLGRRAGKDRDQVAGGHGKKVAGGGREGGRRMGGGAKKSSRRAFLCLQHVSQPPYHQEPDTKSLTEFLHQVVAGFDVL